MMALVVVACTRGPVSDAPGQDTVAAKAPGNSAPAERSLASGTRVTATLQDAISSRSNRAGEQVRAFVSADVTDMRGRVVIPSGATVMLTIAALEPASDHTTPDGKLALDASSVMVNAASYALSVALDPIPHLLQGRGITGGAGGAVAGTAVAVRYAQRDVVVTAGTPIAFTLTQALTVSAK